MALKKKKSKQAVKKSSAKKTAKKSLLKKKKAVKKPLSKKIKSSKLKKSRKKKIKTPTGVKKTGASKKGAGSTAARKNKTTSVKKKKMKKTPPAVHVKSNLKKTAFILPESFEDEFGVSGDSFKEPEKKAVYPEEAVFEDDLGDEHSELHDEDENLTSSYEDDPFDAMEEDEDSMGAAGLDEEDSLFGNDNSKDGSDDSEFF